jgi:hypothetical protein
MPKKPYSDGAPPVNPEDDDRRRETLRSLDLISTEELLDGLGCSKKTLAILRRHGLEQLGPGKQKFYRRSAVVAALEREARSGERTDDDTEDDE